jgi:hypothetical protein
LATLWPSAMASNSVPMPRRWIDFGGVLAGRAQGGLDAGGAQPFQQLARAGQQVGGRDRL